MHVAGTNAYRCAVPHKRAKNVTDPNFGSQPRSEARDVPCRLAKQEPPLERLPPAHFSVSSLPPHNRRSNMSGFLPRLPLFMIGTL